MLKVKNPLLKLDLKREDSFISNEIFSIYENVFSLYDLILSNPFENLWFELFSIILGYCQLGLYLFDSTFDTIWNQNKLIGNIYKFFRYFNINGLLLESPKIYITIIAILIIIILLSMVFLLLMPIRIKHKKLNLIWTISFLKIFLPIISYTFFGQIFLLLTTVFGCNGQSNIICSSFPCRSGIWFDILGPLSIISIIFECLIALITNILYFKPFFDNGSDILKKTTSIPELSFLLMKIGLNTLFIILDEKEDKQWINLFFSILFTGVNTFINFMYQNRANKILELLHNIFNFILFTGFLSLAIARMLIELQFSGAIYFYFTNIALIILYFIFYKYKDINFIAINSIEIDNQFKYFQYIYKFNDIVQNQKNSRNYYTILESLICEIEENCILLDCPLKQYIYNLKNGIESPFLLKQYCIKLFEYGISKFPDDISLKINYSIFLVTQMNYKNKALMIINNAKKSISFLDNYSIYRTLKFIEKWDFSKEKGININVLFKNKNKEFKYLIKSLAYLYYDFYTLLLESKSRNKDSFNKIHNIGKEIMENNKKIEEVFNLIINEKADNSEIIKLYSEYIETILFNEEKLDNSLNISKIYANTFDLKEIDYSNFNFENLNEKENLPFMIVSTYKEEFGEIIDISLNALKILGYSKSELIGQHINILIPKIFRKTHDSIILNNYKKDKFKLFDNLSKIKIYSPEIIKKEIYAISKMQFLIELMTNIYFVKTEEENKFIYIIEITNYTPLMIDLINNSINISKYCVLTDDNLLIQTFTPNCLEFLNLSYSNINSSYSIINYIKQFKEDYMIALNHSEILKKSHSFISKSEIFEKTLEQSNKKKIITPDLKKKIKNDFLNQKYSKKCKITWKIPSENNNKYISSFEENNNNKIFGFRVTNNEENNIIPKQEKEIYMEVKRITINGESLGYYFYFSNYKNKNYNNMSYNLKNSEISEQNIFFRKLKKYTCKFIIKSNIGDLNEMNPEKIFSSLSPKQSIIEEEKNQINKVRKTGKKGSLEKTKVTFKEIDRKEKLNYSLISLKNEESKLDELLAEDNKIFISDDYIPEYKYHFTIDLNDMSFARVSTRENLDYLDILKNEANKKITEYQEQLQLLSKYSETNNESEEIESEEDYEDSSKDSDLSNTKSNSEKSNKSMKKQSPTLNNSEIKEQKDLNSKSKLENNNLKNDIPSNKEINKAMSSKKLPKNNSLYNFYKVNLNNMHYMIFDFYREMIIEGNKKEICSKIESILNKGKNLESLDFEKDQNFSFISLFNKNKKKENKNNANQEKLLNNNSSNLINEEELHKKRIFETLNKREDEAPIKKLKILIIISFVVLIIYGIFCLFLDLLYLGFISQALYLIKHITFLKYYSEFSTYYLRELTLLNFEFEGINGGKYIKYISRKKENYIKLIKDKLMELFIENQKSLQEIYSSSLGLSPNHTKIISEYKLKVKTSQIEMSYDILTSFMEYSGSFYNLASSSSSITQNHTDLSDFIFNNLNEYFNGFNILIEIYSEELNKYLKIINYIVTFGCISILLAFSLNFYLIINSFLKAIQKRGNYMKVFYGIDTNVLKNLINNCENLMNKLKSSKEQKYHEEEETINESMEEKNNIVENKIKNKKNTISNNLNYGNENHLNNKASYTSIIFIIIYTIFNIITYIYIVYNGIYMINTSKKSISISQINYKMQNHHISMIYYFNVYREFLFDNESKINGINIEKFLDNFEKEKVSNILEDINTISKGLRQLLSDTTNLSISLCNYYINDYFDSIYECQEQIGLISTYTIPFLSTYFFEEVKIAKNFAKIKFKENEILGNLTNYNFDEYSKLIPIIGNNSNDNSKEGYQYLDDENDDTKKTIFRLELFNSEILHEKINVIFFSIILPYIERNAKPIYEDLNIDGAKSIIKILNISFYVVIILLYFIYFIPIIRFINIKIYKTKNMLSIIPLEILSSQNGVSELLNIEK